VKPNLLIVLPDMAAGGAQPMNLRLARQLRLRGWQVSIAVLFDRPVAVTAAQLEGLDTVQLRARGPFAKARLPMQLARLAAHADVVLGGMEFAATNYGYVAARLVSKPFISWTHIAFHRHQYSARRLDRWISGKVYKRLRRVVFPSFGALNSLRRVVGSAPRHAQWQVIENFFDDVPCSPKSSVPDCKVYTKPVIIGVGRFVTQKAFDRLIRAHAALRAQGGDQHLVLLGDGPQRETLHQLVRELDVERSVFMPGHVQDVRPWLDHATIFALCSNYEGLPLVLLEAMQAGLPVVSMDCPSGPREILDGGRFGVLVPDQDEVSFQRALAHLLQSPQEREKFSMLGKIRVEHYSADRIVPLWENLLLQVARRK
jgi:glycosyltransferase involved in cell wall biosynthesis